MIPQEFKLNNGYFFSDLWSNFSVQILGIFVLKVPVSQCVSLILTFLQDEGCRVTDVLFFFFLLFIKKKEKKSFSFCLSLSLVC